MNEDFWTIVALLSSVVLAGGLFLDWYTWSHYKSDHAPRLPTWNVKYWRPAKRSWFREERGFKLNRIALLLYIVAGVLGLPAWFILNRG